MKKQHKSYSRPKKKWDLKRIEEENLLLKEFGLKNKKELWKSASKVNVFRGKAKTLLVASEQEQKNFLNRLINMGLINEGSKIDDVLALTTTDILNRRLQTIVVKKNLATTAKQARQMITHKRIIVGDNIVNVPSFIVTRELENQIKIKHKIKKEKPKLEIGQPVEKAAEQTGEQ